jgi:hypothetical protein
MGKNFFVQLGDDVVQSKVLTQKIQLKKLLLNNRIFKIEYSELNKQDGWNNKAKARELASKCSLLLQDTLVILNNALTIDIVKKNEKYKLKLKELIKVAKTLTDKHNKFLDRKEPDDIKKFLDVRSGNITKVVDNTTKIMGNITKPQTINMRRSARASNSNKANYLKEAFEAYYNNGLDKILKLRIKQYDQDGIISKIKLLESKILEKHISKSDLLNLATLLSTYIYDYSYVILPLMIPVQNEESFMHWVGIVVKKDNNKILIKYLDSENQSPYLSIQHDLVSIMKYLLVNQDVVFQQVYVEKQRYNNCGPELVENIIYNFVDARATQESAPYLHSLLYENSVTDPEVSSLQIEENIKIVAQLSKQLIPIYRMPHNIANFVDELEQCIDNEEYYGNYHKNYHLEKYHNTPKEIPKIVSLIDVTSEKTSITAVISKLITYHFTHYPTDQKLGFADNQLIKMQVPNYIGDHQDYSTYSETYSDIKLLLKYNSENNNKELNPNYEMAFDMLKLRNTVEFLPIFRYFVKEVLYPLTKDILPESVKNFQFSDFNSLALYGIHLSASISGAYALNLDAPLQSGVESSTFFGVRMLFKEYFSRISPLDLVDNINMAGYCTANTALQFAPELLLWSNIAPHKSALMKGSSWVVMQKLTISTAECYSAYSQMHSNQEQLPNKIDFILPYIADGIALVSSITSSLNPFYLITNIVVTDGLTKLALSIVPQQIKTEYIEPIIGYLGIEDSWFY